MVAPQEVGRPPADVLLLLRGDSPPTTGAGHDPDHFVASGMLIPRSEPRQLVFSAHDPDQGRLGDVSLGVFPANARNFEVYLAGQGYFVRTICCYSSGVFASP